MWNVVQFIIGMAIGYAELKLCDYVYYSQERKRNRKL